MGMQNLGLSSTTGYPAQKFDPNQPVSGAQPITGYAQAPQSFNPAQPTGAPQMQPSAVQPYNAQPNPYGSAQGAANTGASGNTYGGSNPYLQQNIDSTMGDITRQYQNAVAPQRAGAMAASGSFGNSGQQQMQLEDQRNLGQTMANTSGQMRMADYTQQQAMYQQDQQNRLAGRGQDITREGQQNQYNLGLGQNSNQLLGIQNQFELGKMGDSTQRYGYDKSLEASKYGADASSSASRFASSNAYNLGLRSNDLGYAQLDANINNSNFNNQLAGADFGLKAYGALQGGNNLGLTAGTQMQNTPLNYQTQFSNMANSAGGLGNSTTQQMPGDPLAGGMAGYQLYNAYNKSQPQAVVDGGYSIGQGSAYGGNRRGL